MKVNSIFYLIMESLKNLVRHAWMSIVSLSAVSVTLLMIGLIMVLGLNISYFMKQIEDNTEIRVHLVKEATEDETDILKKQLEKFSEVIEVSFSSKDEELSRASQEMGYESLYKLYGGMSNPLSDVFVVKLRDSRTMSETAEQMKVLDNVEDINYGKVHVEKLFLTTSWIRRIGIFLIAALGAIATFLIMNTVRITIFARRNEIEVMRLVGATNVFIKFPFFLEGIWIGILGSIVPIVVVYSGYNLLVDSNFQGGLDLPFLNLLEPRQLIFNVSAILLLTGCVIGSIASMFSLRKYMRK